MVPYSALFIDIDDTLLPNHSDSISPAVISAIFDIQQKIHVCLATGRTKDRALPIIKALHIHGPCILDHGTQIYDPVENQILEEILLDDTAVRAVGEVFGRYHVALQYYNGERESVFTIGTSYPKVLDISSDDIDADVLPRLVSDLQSIPGIALYKTIQETPGFAGIEVTNKRATKGNGLRIVANLLRIAPEETIAIGDGHSDLSLFESAGYKIAMGNAIYELKAKADMIGPTVYEDGVAYIITTQLLPRLRGLK